MKRLLLSSLLTLAFALPAHAEEMDMSSMQMEDHVQKKSHEMMGHEHMDGRDHMMGHEHGMEMGSMDRMGSMMGMCLKHAKEIGLTPEQVKQVTPMHREMQKSQIRFGADLKIAEMDLHDIMAVKDFDLEKANAAVKKIGDMKTAHHLEMLKSMKEVRAVLTEEQFQKMKKLMPMKMDGKKPVHKMKRPMKK
jgi:Spy/CpxP family protein refolding chaperone